MPGRDCRNVRKGYHCDLCGDAPGSVTIEYATDGIIFDYLYKYLIQIQTGGERMIRGIYTGAASMLAETLRTDVTANNLANANTAGFKKEVAVNKEFANLLVQRINDNPNSNGIGTMGVGALVDEIATIQTPGNMRQTGNPLDVAIDGRGFFVIDTPNGPRYTRNGTFSRSAQGELVTNEGFPVRGQQGRIAFPDNEPVTIAADGRVMSGGVEIDSISIVDFTDLKQLVKQGDSLFDVPGGAQPQQLQDPQLHQGYLEMSNVNIVSEMVNLIAGYRAYEVSGKVVQAHDQLLDKAVNEVGRV